METQTQQKRLQLSRDKHIIYIKRLDREDLKDKKYRYDLKLKKFERLNRYGFWEDVKQAYNFFYDLDIDDIESSEPHFIKMIDLVKDANNNCKSLSTFFTRMGELMFLENYLQEGIAIEIDSYRGWNNRLVCRLLTKPLSFYSKDIINFFKKNNIKITLNLEKRFIENYEAMKKIIDALEYTELTNEEQRDFFNLIERGYSGAHDFNTLITQFNYDAKALLNYVYKYLKPFENLDPTESFELLKDYYDMSNRIGRVVKKYPKYLKSMHDIISSNYNAFKKEYDEKLFNELIKFDLEYEDEYRPFCILVPKSTKDIVKEGTELNHCVGSYCDKILKKETYIFFMREKKIKNSSLLTLEYKNNAIVQCKGSYNRQPTEDEIKFLQFYCKKKEIELKI